MPSTSSRAPSIALESIPEDGVLSCASSYAPGPPVPDFATRATSALVRAAGCLAPASSPTSPAALSPAASSAIATAVRHAAAEIVRAALVADRLSGEGVHDAGAEYTLTVQPAGECSEEYPRLVEMLAAAAGARADTGGVISADADTDVEDDLPTPRAAKPDPLVMALDAVALAGSGSAVTSSITGAHSSNHYVILCKGDQVFGHSRMALATVALGVALSAETGEVLATSLAVLDDEDE
ncbi:hypothetical protein Q5752_001759 [Cryptotrichosporon argae]